MRNVFRVIDFETSGLPGKDKNPEVIEFASMDLICESGEQDHLRAYLKFRTDNEVSGFCSIEGEIPHRVSAVNHIIKEYLEGAESFEFYQREYLVKDFDYLVAHNAAFEKKFIDKAIVPMDKWFCTMNAAKVLFPDLESYSLQYLRYHFGLCLGKTRFTKAFPPHRSASDVFVTLCILKKMIEEKGLDDVIEAGTKTLKDFTLRFGKYKGKHFSNVPKEYLLWCLEKDFINIQTKELMVEFLENEI